MKIHFILGLCKKAILTLTFLLVMLRCADDQLLIDVTAELSSTDLSTTTSNSIGVMDCSSCDYVVPEGQTIIDGATLKLEPGSIIGLSSSVMYGNLIFRNIVGTEDSPIIIKNCGGVAQIDGTGKANGIKVENSKHFRITGGDVDQIYGIKIIAGHMGLSLGYLTTNLEVDHLEIMNSGFAGIMAKTDPTCNEATWRENFLMEDVEIHDNFIYDTGGEGIYAGNSWFMGMNTACGVKLPHEIHNISIFNNILNNTGWEAIQLGCATKGASIHGNKIENYGLVNKAGQNNGIQISSGTGGLCYNNLIKKGAGNGMIVMGLGDNIIFNNIIDEAGNFGIFCDERETPGPGFVFLNNTIINSKSDGIRIYAELVPMNVMVNNIIANPGSYLTYTYPRSPEDAFVYTLNDDVKIEMANNYFTTDILSLEMLDLLQSDDGIENNSPVIDKGADISAYYNILTDFYGNPRLSGENYDIGAIEAVTVTENLPPVANAGPNQKIILPASSTTLHGSGTDSDGSIVAYSWTQYGGSPAEISNAESATATISGLTEGKYYFRLTVQDDRGATHYDNMLVKVETNIAPIANAGPNQILILPTNTTKLYGTGTDSDGSIVAYTWTQYGGPSAVITNAKSATATVSGLAAGKYYFRLTVKDDDGSTHYDNMLIKVYEPVDSGADLEASIEANEVPEANAGPNHILSLPTNSTVLYGTGTDSDGSIIAFNWTQYGGADAEISDANAATATVSGLEAGKYYFRLTVTDNDGATNYDNMLIKVLAPSDDI